LDENTYPPLAYQEILGVKNFNPDLTTETYLQWECSDPSNLGPASCPSPSGFWNQNSFLIWLTDGVIPY